MSDESQSPDARTAKRYAKVLASPSANNIADFKISPLGYTSQAAEHTARRLRASTAKGNRERPRIPRTIRWVSPPSHS